MSADPYRSSSPNLNDATEASANGDLAPALWCFWAVTVLRVIAGLARNEAFGTELTAALLFALFTPWLLRGSSRSRRSPERPR